MKQSVDVPITPIEIPRSFAKDRGVRALVTAWIHLHQKYRANSKRVNWSNRWASEIEKKRRRRKWRAVAKILDIEASLRRMIAKETRHPDIWMSKADDAPESRRMMLLRRYEQNRRTTHNLTGEKREKMMRFRTTRVREIRELDRAWMVAIMEAVHPGHKPPRPIKLHPRELTPRKIKTASRELTEESV